MTILLVTRRITQTLQMSCHSLYKNNLHTESIDLKQRQLEKSDKTLTLPSELSQASKLFLTNWSRLLNANQLLLLVQCCLLKCLIADLEGHDQ